MISAEKVRKSLEKLVLKPFIACQFCTATCSLDLMGLAYSDANEPVFMEKIRDILKSALKSRNMKELANEVYAKSSRNIFLQSLGSSKRQLSYCTAVHLLEQLLNRLTPEQRAQIGNLVQTELRSLIS